MSQTKTGSLTEALANIFVGFALNFGINILTLPYLWDPASPKLSALYIGLVFTFVSLVRQYILRRKFDSVKFGHVPTARREPEA